MNCAIYIDADNVSYKSIDEILSRANNCNILLKKIYADWTHESMKKWAEKAKKYGLQGIQCFGNERKQTSDIYMVTDIINDLYVNEFIEMVILATSDIDFTHLCHIIKSKNKKLVIFTPQKSNISNLETIVKKIKVETEEPIAKKQKLTPKKEITISNKGEDKIIDYLMEAMKDSNSIYISKYKKNLKKIVPGKIKGFDVNHIDKELVKYPNHFSLMKKGNKIKVLGLFQLHCYSKEDFDNNKELIESKHNEIFKIHNYEKIVKTINKFNS